MKKNRVLHFVIQVGYKTPVKEEMNINGSGEGI